MDELHLHLRYQLNLYYNSKTDLWESELVAVRPYGLKETIKEDISLSIESAAIKALAIL